MTVAPGGTDGHGHSLGEDKQDSEVDFHSNHREPVGPGLALGGEDHQVQGVGRASGCPSVARPALVWSHGRHRSPTWTEGRGDSGSTARHRGNLNQPQGELEASDQDSDESRFNSHPVHVASALTFPHPLPRERGFGF